jgi:hypothetical protein
MSRTEGAQAESAMGHKTAPPQSPRNGKVRTVIISLHRSDAGWRLSVPSSAVEQIERELVGAK